MGFHNSIFAGPRSRLFSQGREASCSETTTYSPNPPPAAVAVGIADPCNLYSACDRCAECYGKPKLLFSGSEFSHMRVAWNLVSVHRARTGKASTWPVLGLSAMWENPIVSTSSSSSKGLGSERRSHYPRPNLHLTPRDLSRILCKILMLPHCPVCSQDAAGFSIPARHGAVSQKHLGLYGVGVERWLPRLAHAPGIVHNVSGIAGARQLGSIFSCYNLRTRTCSLTSSVSSVWESRARGLGQLYIALEKQVQEPHDGEHLTLITCRHHTGCFHFPSSWYFWGTWGAGSLHSCKHRFEQLRSPIPFTYQYFPVSAMRVSY